MGERLIFWWLYFLSLVVLVLTPGHDITSIGRLIDLFAGAGLIVCMTIAFWRCVIKPDGRRGSEPSERVATPKDTP